MQKWKYKITYHSLLQRNVPLKKYKKQNIPSLVHIHEEMRLNLSAAADPKKIFMLTPEKSNSRKTRCANVNTRKWRFLAFFLYYLFGGVSAPKKRGRFDIYIEHVADLTFDFSSLRVRKKSLSSSSIFSILGWD